MSVTLVYIPKKLISFDMIQEDIRNDIIEKTYVRIESYRDDYEYFSTEVPDANDSLHIMWRELINKGYVLESDTGYYDEDGEYFHCPVLHLMILLLKRLEFAFDTISLDRDECSCIININSTGYRDKIKIPIEETFR